MLNALRNFNAEETNVDEMVSLSAFGSTLSAEYAALNVDAPEWLGTQIKAVRREIQSRLADVREKRIREIERSLETLKSADEKRQDLRLELERLKGVPV